MSAITIFLATIDLFQTLSDDELEVLSSFFHKRSFTRGERLIEEGTVGDELFVILTGFVNIYYGPKAKEVFITSIGPGEHFGEMALFENSSRMASVVAHDSVELLVINRERFQVFIELYPAAACRILHQMLKVISSRLATTSRELYGSRKEGLDQKRVDQLVLWMMG